MEYREEEFLNLAGIQHFSFCRRQWALIHIEQQWKEDLRTVEGHILHERAHDEFFSEKRGDMVVSRGLPVFSRRLGTNGICDVVEFHRAAEGVDVFGLEGKWLPIPVEYKRGRPKEIDADRLQLCCQVMCLEEMLLCEIKEAYLYYGFHFSPAYELDWLCEIKEAYLYYGETRHRTSVILDLDLRNKVEKIFAEMHDLYNRSYTPQVKPTKSCNACSLKDLCMPKLYKNCSASTYVEQMLQEENI